MCTAISFLTHDHYFGRNLDLEYHYNESVVITPRKFPLAFRFEKTQHSHYAMIGMAYIKDEYPLYYEATNEAGLSMAGLNFPGNAVYSKKKGDMVNIAPFEFIPWILGECRCVSEVKLLLKNINLVNVPFSKDLSITPLHWLISDRESSLVVEPIESGLRIYDNPIGVLANSPPFDYHLYHLSNFLNLTRDEPRNRFAPDTDILPYSRGMGAIGLPGDLSSSSRFIRASFTKLNSVCRDDEASSVNQFFHILNAVEQQEGCVKIGNAFEKTVYSSCCNTDQGIYYYSTYENRQLTAISLFHADLDSDVLLPFPLRTKMKILHEN